MSRAEKVQRKAPMERFSEPSRDVRRYRNSNFAAINIHEMDVVGCALA